MTTGQLLWGLLVGGSLLVLVLAVFIKLRGPSRWSLGIGLFVVAGATVSLGWLIVIDLENLNWRLIGLLVAMLGGFITGLRQFVQLKPSPVKPLDSTDGPL
ncbi:MAG: hypothetical protein OSB47_04075 [Pirellulaceae bacterium]|jgi:hypothetical protein|nr:hypothetical protein [Pirellulaceae bacterium]|tara:strand:+ start:413 stop:715 length:303 start_codon:yes stop_codon:yes gene_type:complete